VLEHLVEHLKSNVPKFHNFFKSSINIFNICNNIWCLKNKWRFKHLGRSNNVRVLFIYELFLPGHEQVSYHNHPSHGLANGKPWHDLYFGNASRNQDIYKKLSNWKQSHLYQPSFQHIYDEKNQQPLKCKHDLKNLFLVVVWIIRGVPIVLEILRRVLSR